MLVVIENSELAFGHDVGIWLALDLAPDVVDGPVKYTASRRVDLAVFTVPCYLKRSFDIRRLRGHVGSLGSSDDLRDWRGSNERV